MAAVKSHELTIIEEVVNSYPKLNPSTPSSWALFSADMLQVDVTKQDICHAKLCHVTPNVFDTLITAAPKAKFAGDYYRWLCDRPFTAYSDLINLEKTEKGELYFRCSNLDKWPSNVLSNFCIATRVPIERYGIITRWAKFISVGIDPSVAFMVSHRVGPVPFGPFVGEPDLSGDPWDFVPLINMYAANHMWLNPTADWSHVINGTMDPDKVRKESFKEAPNLCFPTNTIWGRVGPDYLEALSGLSMEVLQKHFNLPNVRHKPKPDPKAIKNRNRNKLFKAVLEELEFGHVQDHQPPQQEQLLNPALEVVFPGGAAAVANDILIQNNHWLNVNPMNIHFGDPHAFNPEQPDQVPQPPQDDDFDDEFVDWAHDDEEEDD